MSPADLFQTRIALIQVFLQDHGYDGILLTRPDNFAMATGGRRNYIYAYTDAGSNSLFVNRDGRAWFVGNTIESPRVMNEELAGLDCGKVEYLWFERTDAEAARSVFRGNLVSDDGSIGQNVHADLALLRALLTPIELDKYRRLGSLASEAMVATLDTIKPNMPEADIAATLVHEGLKRRCQVPVSLVAVDDRIGRYRHPLPTEQPLLHDYMSEHQLKGYVMVVGCFLKEGLVVSLTRFKKVAPLPAGISSAYDRICGVDAIMQEETLPGRTLGDVFSACQNAYQSLGFNPDEWHNHHQGGCAGYAGRSCKGSPGEPFPILPDGWNAKVSDIIGRDIQFGMAFAWNPSAPGIKSEDTFLLLPDASKEIITTTPSLPRVDLARVLGRDSSVVKSGIAAS